MKNRVISMVIMLCVLIINACKKDDPLVKPIEYTTVNDIDGNQYKAVTIGTQVWMAENLRTTKFKNGSDISNVTDNTDWANLSTPAYCWYNNDEVSNKETYGALYNWYTVETGILCPTGWHVPTESEWITLEKYVNDDGNEQAIGRALKSVDGWKLSDNSEYWGTDNYGFNGLPSGQRKKNGLFVDIGEQLQMWASTPGVEEGSAHVRIYQYQGKQNYYSQDSQKNGFAVRCLKD